MSVIWSWTYFYDLHWNNYLYFKGLLYIWEEMIMMALLHMAGLENSECIWKIQRKPEVAVSVSMTEIFTKPRSLNFLVQFVWMWQPKREISRECNDIIGSAKGSQISEKYWGEVGKGQRVDIYLEVRKRRGHIFFEWNKCLWGRHQVVWSLLLKTGDFYNNTIFVLNESMLYQIFSAFIYF
jgi:hypothetical protein